jgi:hypothetical protein
VIKYFLNKSLSHVFNNTHIFTHTQQRKKTKKTQTLKPGIMVANRSRPTIKGIAVDVAAASIVSVTKSFNIGNWHG